VVRRWGGVARHRRPGDQPVVRRDVPEQRGAVTRCRLLLQRGVGDDRRRRVGDGQRGHDRQRDLDEGGGAVDDEEATAGDERDRDPTGQCGAEEIAVERLRVRAREEGREDDTPEGIARRLAIYHEQTEPVVERYRATGKLVPLHADRSIEQVADEIEQALELLDEVDERIGLDRLRCLHINDSKLPFDSHRDRHENVPDGEIGQDMAVFLGSPRIQHLPAILETPGPDNRGADAAQVRRLKRLHRKGVALWQAVPTAST